MNFTGRLREALAQEREEQGAGAPAAQRSELTERFAQGADHSGVESRTAPWSPASLMRY